MFQNKQENVWVLRSIPNNAAVRQHHVIAYTGSPTDVPWESAQISRVIRDNRIPFFFIRLIDLRNIYFKLV